MVFKRTGRALNKGKQGSVGKDRGVTGAEVYRGLVPNLPGKVASTYQNRGGVAKLGMRKNVGWG